MRNTIIVTFESSEADAESIANDLHNYMTGQVVHKENHETLRNARISLSHTT